MAGPASRNFIQTRRMERRSAKVKQLIPIDDAFRHGRDTTFGDCLSATIRRSKTTTTPACSAGPLHLYADVTHSS